LDPVPDPHRSERLDPDPQQSETKDPDYIKVANSYNLKQDTDRINMRIRNNAITYAFWFIFYIFFTAADSTYLPYPQVNIGWHHHLGEDPGENR
jgi:hypothetical protein